MTDQRCNRCENLYYPCYTCRGEEHEWVMIDPEPDEYWVCVACGVVWYPDPEIVSFASTGNRTTWVTLPI